MLLTTDSECNSENILFIKELGVKKCLVNQAVTMDYNCRYNKVERPNCYCCGELHTYIELGKLCTKFCKKKNMEAQQPRVGQQPIIELPFNWGEGPDRVELEGEVK